jgi:hypothetical protein
MVVWVVVWTLLPGAIAQQHDAQQPSAPHSGALQLAAAIDQRLAAHWQAQGIAPAPTADDATFHRRAMLDLAGRIPTAAETESFLADTSPDKRSALLASLLESPQFVAHFAHVLDDFIQQRHAGHEPFLAYLRQAVQENRSWDVLFREMMVGPWDAPPRQAANTFLDRRARDLDALTADTARVFFGVDISCARCHDHPLVADWSQDHYYGLAAFFVRTTGGRGSVSEKKEGEVKFLASDGQERVAPMMFLTGRQADDELLAVLDAQPQQGPGANPGTRSRRDYLVAATLAEPEFFSRALVNRLWDYFFGRGLVDPVDQMHSGNPPSVPGLLEYLAEDFRASRYDLRRLVAALVHTRLYALDSRWPSASGAEPGPEPQAAHFASARLRPLSPRQMALALRIATGHAQPRADGDLAQQMQHYLELEKQSAPLAAAFDARRADFQSSASEALFVSNHPSIQQLLASPEGQPSTGLVPELAALPTNELVVQRAMLSVLSRRPTDEERQELSAWLAAQGGDRPTACAQLVWALLASAEFRFNH